MLGMKRQISCILILLSVLFVVYSCNNDRTYADQKERERKAIVSFVDRDINIVSRDGDTLCKVGKIKTITLEQFEKQDSMTDVSKNEYVLFGNNGVYMQIVRKGSGEKLAEGQSRRLIVRFIEYNILGDSLQAGNNNSAYSLVPEYINVTNSYGVMTGSFDVSVPTGSLMFQLYNSTSVPNGWLVPLSYVNIGRAKDDVSNIAKVRLIVPHSQGQAHATSYVYPCFYELSFQEARN